MHACCSTVLTSWLLQQACTAAACNGVSCRLDRAWSSPAGSASSALLPCPAEQPWLHRCSLGLPSPAWQSLQPVQRVSPALLAHALSSPARSTLLHVAACTLPVLQADHCSQLATSQVPVCCMSITSISLPCRAMVTRMFNKESGYEADCDVIYGDTDSVMVNFKVPDVARAMTLGRQAAEEVSKTFIKPIKLEFEKVRLPASC